MVKKKSEKKRNRHRQNSDSRSIGHSWQCFQLAFLVSWKVTFSAQSEQVSTNGSVLFISWLVTIWKILYSIILKQSISYRLVFIIWFCLDRDHRKGVIKIRLRTTKKSARNEGWLVYFSHCIGILVLVFLLSSVLFHTSDGVTGLFFLKHCTLLPTTLEMGKINNRAYFTENVLRKTLEMAFPRP